MRIAVLFLVLAQTTDLSTPTGVTDEDLADSPATDAIPMHATKVTNQLALTLAVTPGSTVAVHVSCEERGSAAEGWQPIPLCDAQTPATCKPDVRVFSLADYTADGEGVKWITSRWGVRKRFARCVMDDPDDGSGTVTAFAWRSWQ